MGKLPFLRFFHIFAYNRYAHTREKQRRGGVGNGEFFFATPKGPFCSERRKNEAPLQKTFVDFNKSLSGYCFFKEKFVPLQMCKCFNETIWK